MSECLILHAKEDSWIPSLGLPKDFPQANKIAFWVNEEGRCFVTPKAVPTDHNGDLWLFAHGGNNGGTKYEDLTGDGEVMKVHHTVQIFGHTFVRDGNTYGKTVNSNTLFKYLNAAGVMRLFIFACYQGDNLSSYAKGIRSLNRCEGLSGPANRSAASAFLKEYFRDRNQAKYLDVRLDTGAIRARYEGMIASYAAALASLN